MKRKQPCELTDENAEEIASEIRSILSGKCFTVFCTGGCGMSIRASQELTPFRASVEVVRSPGCEAIRLTVSASSTESPAITEYVFSNEPPLNVSRSIWERHELPHFTFSPKEIEVSFRPIRAPQDVYRLTFRVF